MIEPNQLADVWYLRFGHQWIARSDLDEDWKKIAEVLMKNDYLRYELCAWQSPDISKLRPKQVVDGPTGVTEILKLKGEEGANN